MKNNAQNLVSKLLIGLCVAGLAACAEPAVQTNTTGDRPSPEAAPPSPDASAEVAQSEPVPRSTTCELVESGFGPPGQVSLQVEEVATGLEVPWGIAFLPNGDLLVTERAGQIRLVQNGQLQPSPVAEVAATEEGEGGLLGIAVHPDFESNRWFYVYYTTDQNGTPVNRVERWRLSDDGQSATADQIIVDNIPVALYHNGGRIRFGPDGMLYVGTGDAREPSVSQDVNDVAGKILRVTPEGDVPPDNPYPNNPVYISGIRNTQGFDWSDQNTLWVTDHGPSGELGLRGLDKVSVAQAGDNLGWPEIYGCQQQGDLVRPVLTWRDAVPPGGAAIYTGTAIPEWQGSLIIGTLGSRHLHRVALDDSGALQTHEVYLQDQYGRLREVIMGPDGDLYVTTSNCDGRGSCPAEGDKILRITGS